MKFLRNNIISRLICFAFALHIFNVSVDSPDGMPNYVPEDLSVNDIESVVELVLEDVLKIDNAIVEYDEPDDQDDETISIKKLELYFQKNIPIPVVLTQAQTPTLIINYKETFYPNLYVNILTPPPKA